MACTFGPNRKRPNTTDRLRSTGRNSVARRCSRLWREGRSGDTIKYHICRYYAITRHCAVHVLGTRVGACVNIRSTLGRGDTGEGRCCAGREDVCER